MNECNIITVSDEITNNQISFCVGDTKLILSEEGFEFNGEIIKDAGKAYQLFINFMMYHKLNIY
ncbi:MAG: hypothetical protein ACOC2W_00570 [bacterium]